MTWDEIAASLPDKKPWTLAVTERRLALLLEDALQEMERSFEAYSQDRSVLNRIEYDSACCEVIEARRTVRDGMRYILTDRAIRSMRKTRAEILADTELVPEWAE
jgi:hypothetical protein